MNAIQTLIDRCDQDATTLAMENWLRLTKEAQTQLAALLAAGNAMAARLMSLRDFSNEAFARAEGYVNASTLFTDEDNYALAAWEQVTK